ncbi:MAG: hypothetical protein HXX16_18180 [Bacteroidales bacterium]|nr:hypothetical protein [Bacteroidales bacterium]
MKAKKLNEELFGKMELNSADMKMVKGEGIIDSCYSGSGPDGWGGCVQEWCVVFDTGRSKIITVPCD